MWRSLCCAIENEQDLTRLKRKRADFHDQTPACSFCNLCACNGFYRIPPPLYENVMILSVGETLSMTVFVCNSRVEGTWKDIW